VLFQHRPVMLQKPSRVSPVQSDLVSSAPQISRKRGGAVFIKPVRLDPILLVAAMNTTPRRE